MKGHFSNIIHVKKSVRWDGEGHMTTCHMCGDRRGVCHLWWSTYHHSILCSASWNA